jgi:hypothetical protein
MRRHQPIHKVNFIIGDGSEVVQLTAAGNSADMEQKQLKSIDNL